jgi:hypothetical protein
MSLGATCAVVATFKTQKCNSYNRGMLFPGADLQSAISDLLPVNSITDSRDHANDRFVLT